MRLSLFSKLLRAMSAITLLIAVVPAAVGWWAWRDGQRETAARRAADVSRWLAERLQASVDTPSSGGSDWLRDFVPPAGIELRLYDADGALLAALPAEGDTEASFSTSDMLRVVRGADDTTYVDRGPSPGMHHVRPVVASGVRRVIVDVRAAVEEPNLPRIWWLAALGAWLVAVAASGWMLARHLRPLATLVTGAQYLAGGDDPAIPTSDRRDEIGALTTALREFQQNRRSRTIEFEAKTESLESVLQNMLEGVLAVAHDETILLANEASGRMLGFEPAKAMGKPLVEVVRSRALQAILRKTAHELKSLRDEFESPGEPRRVLSVRSAPLARRTDSGVMIVIHDITELRRLENLRKEFVANVSHELKTPLASIKAYAETLRLGALEDPDFRLGFVERIEEQAERLHALISDLLLLARVEAGREVYEFVDVALETLVHDCLSGFQPIAESKNIQLHGHSSSPPVEVHVDEEGLRTILNNLVDNALKYTPAEGRVSVSWRVEGSFVILEVNDTGIGISPRDQARIFERFYRADKARSRELGGTGLGLAIVKHLAQALGGDVSVTSQEGIGSTFRVRLPLARSSVSAPSERA